MKKQVMALALISVFFTFHGNSTCFAQDISQVDLNKFIAETQLSSGNADQIKMAWWIPIEFWKIVFSKDQSVSAEQTQTYINTLSPYVLFAVVDGEVGSFGGVTYKSYESIKPCIVASDDANRKFNPLDESETSADVKNLLDIFKPVIENMLGQMGQNLHFFVFRDQDSHDKRIFDPFQPGTLHFNVCGEDYKWKLPLSCLLPLKYCPIDHEMMNGAWIYCPWHGEKLLEDKK